MNSDTIIACADLVGRSGAKDFQIGYLHDDVPVEEAGWYAHASYKGARLMAQDHRSPTSAALALSERLLRGAACRCGQPVTLTDTAPGCRWRLMGQRWEPGCNAPSVKVDAEPGDLNAAHNAMASRWERRGQHPDKRRQPNGRRGRRGHQQG